MAVSTIIARERVFSQVHRYIRDKILRGDYPAGARLIESKIAAELNISRTPVREALVMLVGQDLLGSLDSGGFVVRDFRQQLLDILQIRIALETHAVAKAAADISDADIAVLERLCDEMEALPARQVDARAELNRRFHETLIGASGNSRLARMVGDYQDYFRIAQPLFDQGALRRTQAEHRAITAALRRHDIAAATRLVAEHIENAGAQIMASFARSGQEPNTSAGPANNHDPRRKQAGSRSSKGGRS